MNLSCSIAHGRVRGQPGKAADEEALVTAEHENGGQEDAQEQVVLRQEQSEKDTDSCPEKYQTKCFSHAITVFLSALAYSIYMRKSANIEKTKIYFIFADYRV